MEHAIHERFSRRSPGPRSVPRFKRYLKVHITRINPSAITSLIFSEDGRARPSSSFNNPYFCREKVSAGNGYNGPVYCACSSFLANYKLNYSTFVGNAKFPKRLRITYSNLRLTCTIASWWKKKEKTASALLRFPRPSRRAYSFFFSFFNSS